MTSPTSTLDRLYDIRELQDAGYGDRTTLYRLIRANKIPAVRVGVKIKIHESDLPLLAVPVDSSTV